MARFGSDSVVESVRQATDIVDIISQYVRLQKRGKNYLGLCPFHTEKTPSFTVNREKGLYHCFGCGAGGNVFTFLTQHDKISFGEALRQLAARANITLPSYSDGKQSEVDEVLDVNEKASRYYRDMLRSDEGAPTLSYLKDKRRFNDDSIERFMIGYAPDRWDGLLNYLRKKGISEKVIEKSGLILKRQDGSGYYDRFRARVMFPVLSPSGSVIAFGGRAMKADERAKYINSPETAAYVKGRTLFGIYQAKDSMIEKDASILVEGYADLIALHQYGIRNVVASSGTALTADQIQYISRYTQNVYLVYDADTAGQDATLRGADLLLEQGMNVFIVELPAGEDPDTYVLSQGSEAFMTLIGGAVNIVEFKASLLARRSGKSADPAAIIQSIVESLAKVGDAIRVNLYVKTLADKFGLREESIYEELKKKRTSLGARSRQVQPNASANLSQRLSVSDRNLVNIILKVDESFLDVIAKQVDRLEIQNRITSDIVEKSIRARLSGEQMSTVIDQLSTEESRKIFAELATATPGRSKEWWEEIRQGTESPDFVRWFVQFLISYELEQIEQQFKLIHSWTLEAERKGIPTVDLDSQYRELEKRKDFLLHVFADRKLMADYFRDLQNS